MHREGRVAHAQLFLGPEGSGNLAIALAFAQYLFCSNPQEDDSCGTCPSCRKVSGLQYADLHFAFPVIRKDEKTTSDTYMSEWREAALHHPYMDAEFWHSTIADGTKQPVFTVSESVRIMQKMSLRGFEGPLKIMIIWMAELIKTDTANKLLKLLEEPPDNSLFILIANKTDQILPTVLSRVQVLQVGRLSDELIASELKAKGVSSDTSASIAHYVNGNWWLASRMADEGVRDFHSLFKRWMQLCFTRDVAVLLELVDEITSESREIQKQFLTYALEMIRQNIVLNYAGADLTRMSDSEREMSVRFAPFINDLNAEEVMQELGRAHFDISRNVYAKLVFTDLSLKMHRFLNRRP